MEKASTDRAFQQLGSMSALLRNSTGILVSRALTIMVSFAVVPALVKAMGLPGYGACETVLAFAAACNLLQTTVGGVVLRQASEALGAGKPEIAVGFVRKGIAMALASAALAVPTVYALRGRIVVALGIPAAMQDQAATVLALVVGFAMLSVSNDILGGFLSAHQRSGLSNLLQSIGAVAGNLVLIACVWLGFGLFSLAGGTAAGWLLGSTLLYAAGKRRCPALSLRPTLPFKSLPGGTRRYAAFLLFGTVAMFSRDVADKLLMSAIGSAEWAGYFGIAARLSVPVTMACTFFYVPTIAATAALYAREDWDQINRLFRRTSFIIALTAGCLGLLIFAMHRPLIHLWIGRDVPAVSPVLAWLLVGNVSAIVLTGAASSACKGIRHLRPETAYIAIMLGLNIVLKWFLIRHFGPLGTAAASALSWAVASLCFVCLVVRAGRLARDPLRLAVWACLAFILILGLLEVVFESAIPAREGAGVKQWIVSTLFAAASVSSYLGVLVLAGAVKPSYVLAAWHRRGI